MVSCFHRKMQLDTTNTDTMPCIFYNSDSDPYLYLRPLETIDSELCFARFSSSCPLYRDSC